MDGSCSRNPNDENAELTFTWECTKLGKNCDDILDIKEKQVWIYKENLNIDDIISIKLTVHI